MIGTQASKIKSDSRPGPDQFPRPIMVTACEDIAITAGMEDEVATIVSPPHQHQQA
jgi:hypothetical protein